MKNIVSSVMTALAVGTSGLLGMSAFAPSAEAQPAQLLRPAQDREITVTQLRNSGSLGLRSHFIDVVVRDYPLNALRITLPPMFTALTILKSEMVPAQELKLKRPEKVAI
uniref:Uncharacterized protein n=1 Tax=Desertifilum tharense IPPAS B-1220 TaxID=1781255 RepID=A0ACD5H2H9_9CYAN